MSQIPTLLEINDLLIDYLPYEIDNFYIKQLLSDISVLKIDKKSSIPFYQGWSKYDIWQDSLGIKIIRKMIQYYQKIDPNLSSNALMMLTFLKDYNSSIFIEEEKEETKKFLEEFNAQGQEKSYLGYAKEKISQLKVRRRLDPDFDYTENRRLSKFEHYLCNELNISLESNSSVFDSTLKLAEQTEEIAQIFGVYTRPFNNKLYQLNEVISSVDLTKYDEESLNQIVGSILNLESGHSRILKILDLLKSEFQSKNQDREVYDSFLLVFTKIKGDIDSIIKGINTSNYVKKISYMTSKYHLKTSRIYYSYNLDKEVKKKIKDKIAQEKEDQKLKKSEKLIQEYLESGLIVREFCQVKRISKTQFYRYKDQLENQEYSLSKYSKNKDAIDFYESILPFINEVVEKIKNHQFNILEYSLTTEISLQQLSKLAIIMKKNSSSEVINRFIYNHRSSFDLYDPSNYINHYSVNKRVFTKQDNDRLTEYMKRERIKPIAGNSELIIRKILQEENLPTRKNSIWNSPLEKRL